VATSSSRPLISDVAAGVVALAVVLFTGFVIVTNHETPREPLAFVEASAQPQERRPATAGSFCSEPKPILEAPLPSVDAGNAFTFYKWENGRREFFPFDAPGRSEAVDMPDLGNIEPVYIGCITYLANVENVTCVGYPNHVSATLWGHESHVEIYELATAELVESILLGSTRFPICPEQTDGSSEFQGHWPDDLEQAVAHLAAPGTPTLSAAQAEIASADDWCGAPTPLSGLLAGPAIDAGVNRVVASESDERSEDPGAPLQVIFAGYETETLPDHQSSVTLATTLAALDYVICLSFSADAESPITVCPHPDDLIYSELNGQFTVSVVDPSTAAVVASSNFPSSTTCAENLAVPRVSPGRPTVDRAVFEWLGTLPSRR